MVRLISMAIFSEGVKYEGYHFLCLQVADSGGRAYDIFPGRSVCPRRCGSRLFHCVIAVLGLRQGRRVLR
jgi:hypothetical protein